MNNRIKRFCKKALAVLICITFVPINTFTTTANADETNTPQYSDNLYGQAVRVIDNMRTSHSSDTVEQTGVTKATYAETIAKCIAAYSSVLNLNELTGYKQMEGSMQSYSRLISSMAVLVNEGNVTKYKDLDPSIYSSHEDFKNLYIKFMTDAMDSLEKLKGGSSMNFATVELCMAYMLTKDIVPKETADHWLEKIGLIKGTLVKGDGGYYGYPCTTTNNRAAYIDGAEQIRDYLGLVDSNDYITTSISSLAVQFSSNGMFMDRADTSITASPYLYDSTVRAHLTLVDYYGYDGKNSDTLKDWLRKGAISTLLTQASNGEMAYSGRSNQYIFNEVLIASANEYEANYYKSIGDDYLAGVFKRSAHLAIKSLQGYLDAGKHVKNMMEDNVYGTDTYGYYDKYMLSMASFLVMGYLYADDSIKEQYCPCEVGGYVAIEDEGFSSVIASCEDYTIQIQTAAKYDEDSIGLGRIIKAGVPSSFGLSQSFSGDPIYRITEDAKPQFYSFDVAWENSAGKLVKLSDLTSTTTDKPLDTEFTKIKESSDEVIFSIKYTGNIDGADAIIVKYTLNKNGLQIDAELENPVGENIYYTVPLLKTNGSRDGALNPTMTSSENKVTLEEGYYKYSVSSDGTFVNDDTLIYNRNGIYNATHFVKKGNTITVKASLENTMTEQFSVVADDDNITLTLEGYNHNGKTAKVYMMKPYEYHYLDKDSGYDTSTIIDKKNLVCVGEVKLDGKKQTILIDRYEGDVDRVYRKFYIADDSKIYLGPLWVTDITSAAGKAKTKEYLDSKKGLGIAPETTVNYAFRAKELNDLNCATAKTNILLGNFIVSNEEVDDQGNITANAPPQDTKKYKYQSYVAGDGKTYYFKMKGGTASFERLTNAIKSNSDAGIRNTLIVYLQYDGSPDLLIPKGATEAGKSGTNVVAMDSSNEYSEGYIIAFFEFLAQYYSNDENGYIDSIVLGNEIDFLYAWNCNYDCINKGMPDIDDYVEEYYRTLRLANIALEKYSDDITICVPFTHYWGTTGNKLPDYLYNSDAVYSYAPKDIFDILIDKSNAQGDFYWGITPHCYAFNLVTDDPIKCDANLAQYVTCKEDSTFLTYENLEMLDSYLHKEENMFGDRVRPVYLTESGVSCDGSEESQKRQAASIAYIYYKCDLLESVKSWPYIAIVDNSAASAAGGAGLITASDACVEVTEDLKRLSYNVWRDLGVLPVDDFDTQYGEYIHSLESGKDIDTYLDLLIDTGKTFGSRCNWKKLWYKKYYGIDLTTYGDINTDESIDGKDAILLSQYLADWSVVIDADAADVNGDSKINGKDLVLLLQYLADWDVTLGGDK